MIKDLEAINSWDFERRTEELGKAQAYMKSLSKTEIQRILDTVQNLRNLLVEKFDVEQEEISDHPFPTPIDGVIESRELAVWITSQSIEWAKAWNIAVDTFRTESEKIKKDETLDVLVEGAKSSAKNETVLQFIEEELEERTGPVTNATIMLAECFKRIESLTRAATHVLNDNGEAAISELKGGLQSE
jgi:hypothetical protein